MELVIFRMYDSPPPCCLKVSSIVQPLEWNKYISKIIKRREYSNPSTNFIMNGSVEQLEINLAGLYSFPAKDSRPCKA